MNNRKYLFTVTAALIPVVLVVLIELLLRIFDLYPQPPLFIVTFENGQDLIQVNPNVGERYFNKKTIPVPNLYPETFLADKKQNTYRIICVGGSTTAGFPYEMTVPFPRQLDYLLAEDFPDKNFEIINLGLSAINSFTVLDWLPDILHHEPDLILIYMGHNEFYGAYGTGATISLGHNGNFVRFILSLQKLHLVQMLNEVRNRLAPGSATGPSPTIMDKIVAERFIAADSELREITNTNFADNLDIILNKCADSGVQVILSNLVSNLKDQPPLGKNISAPDSAIYFYSKGQDEYDLGNFTGALAAFSESLNRDGIPFRAGTAINTIIRDKAQKYNFAFLDMNDAFRRQSPLGIPGNNLFADHLHPNPAGYNLMAAEFRSAITAQGFLSSSGSPAETKLQPRFVTGLDWEIGAVKIHKLKLNWPFNESETEYMPVLNQVSARIAHDFLFSHHVWGRAHDEMADYYLKSGEFEEACREYQAILKIYPGKTEIYTKLVNSARRAGLWELVAETCRSGLEISADKEIFYYNLAISQRMDGKMPLALQTIQKAIDSPELQRQQIAEYYFTLAVFLRDLNKIPDAVAVLETVIKETPDFQPAQKLLNQLTK